jgi:hypothetical protein
MMYVDSAPQDFFGLPTEPSIRGTVCGKVHGKQESSVKKGSKGFFAVKVKGVAGWLLYDLKKDTYCKAQTGFCSLCVNDSV